MEKGSVLLRVLKWILILVAVLVAGVAVLLLWAQTDSGRDVLTGALESAVAASTDYRLELGNMSGTIPFDLRFDRITLGDGEGTWLELHDLHVVLSVRSLFDLAPWIEELTCGKAVLSRLPSGTGDGQKEPEEPRGEPASLPRELPGMELGSLAVDSLVLEEDVAG